MGLFQRGPRVPRWRSRDEDAAMTTENSETITKVQMEMAQAEKDCLAK